MKRTLKLFVRDVLKKLSGASRGFRFTIDETSSPSVQMNALREDLVPFFRNELQRAFGGIDSGEPNLGRDLPKNLLIDAWHMGASDIHIEPQSKDTRVRVRIDGVIWDVTNITLEQGRLLVN